ncbi:MAG: porin, partial [Alphaproteobacteria bacterium]|nr:porin [Alphaproteobacteria bacterium]
MENENGQGTGRNRAALENDFEVYFQGKTTLDNGITVGVLYQLENPTTGTTQARKDEMMVYLSGGFGTVEVGDRDPMTRRMGLRAPSASSFNADDGSFGFSNGGQNAGGARYQDTLYAPGGTVTTAQALANDRTKVIYLTPRIAGFQLGVSYAPDGNNEHHADGSSFQNKAGISDEISVGVNYSATFGGIRVNAMGAFATADEANAAVPACATTVAGTGCVRSNKDPFLWNIGANVGFGPVTVGGSYANLNKFGAADIRASIWSLGATYNLAPVTIGLSGIVGNSNVPFTGGTAAAPAASAVSNTLNNTTTQTFDTWRLVLDAAYALGPGINLQGGLIYTYQNDLTRNDYDSLALATGIRVAF